MSEANERRDDALADEILLAHGDRVPVRVKLDPWPKLASPALHGLAGDIVRTIAPHSESDPVALLSQLLVLFGCAAGRGVHAFGEADRHFGNEFIALVGETAKARKGSSFGRVRRLFEKADERFAGTRIAGGLVSGEGLIHHVRDANGKDEGESDKRLLAVESELASLLRSMGREGSTLSPTLRLAWDRGDLRTLSKRAPEIATGAHVAVIGHVTEDEARRYLDRTETANGFANRFLWLLVRRSKVLPDGGALHDEDLRVLSERLKRALEFASEFRELRRDEAASRAWHAVYTDLSAGRPGLIGAVLARGESHVLRLSVLYAALDSSPVIRKEHLAAAVALWDYADASARRIFGESLGDSLADDLREALEAAGSEGLDLAELHATTGRHTGAARLRTALELLARLGLAGGVKEPTGGRPRERWRSLLYEREESERSEKSPASSSAETLSSLDSLNSHGEEIPR